MVLRVRAYFQRIKESAKDREMIQRKIRKKSLSVSLKLKRLNNFLKQSGVDEYNST